MFVKFCLLFYLLLLIYDYIQKIKLPSRKEKPKPEKETDIWKHPYIKAAGLKKPIPEAELEECEDVPLCWKIRYNTKQTDFITIQINEKKCLQE